MAPARVHPTISDAWTSQILAHALSWGAMSAHTGFNMPTVYGGVAALHLLAQIFMIVHASFMRTPHTSVQVRNQRSQASLAACWYNVILICWSSAPIQV